jgi:mannose-6-phosphate isomerase-like protein (cupin superfamily)
MQSDLRFATTTDAGLYAIGNSMEIIRSSDFKADKAWGAKDIANMNGITIRLHWTDKPYKWHINNGEEVFVVLSGQVKMLYREEGKEKSSMLNTGDIFFASVGTEHVAHPIGEARILVIENEGSI